MSKRIPKKIFNESLDLYIRHQSPIISSASLFVGVSATVWQQDVSAGLFVLPFILIAFLKRIPKTTNLELPELKRDSKENTKLVIFIHGWRGGSDVTWLDFPRLVMEDNHFNDFNVLSIDYPTYLFRRNLTLSELVTWLLERLRLMERISDYDQIVIIAHSMGGLISKDLVIQSKLSDITSAIELIITIGTPHKGANPAKLLKTIGVDKSFSKELAVNSSYLNTLDVNWNHLKYPPVLHGITSPHDMIVSKESATASCNKKHFYSKWGHTEMAKPEAHDDERYLTPVSIIAEKFNITLKYK